MSSLSPSLRSSKRLSKSNIDVSAPCDSAPALYRPLIRKQSDSCDTNIAGSQGEVFFSRLDLVLLVHFPEVISTTVILVRESLCFFGVLSLDAN